MKEEEDELQAKKLKDKRCPPLDSHSATDQTLGPVDRQTKRQSAAFSWDGTLDPMALWKNSSGVKEVSQEFSLYISLSFWFPIYR